MSESSFRDRVALVTGGGSGIGRALALALSSRGARVMVTDVARADETARMHGGAGEILGADLDVTDADAFAALALRVEKDLGPIDYLFNNAGIAIGGEARDLSLDDWRRVLAVNLSGVIHGVHAVYPRMVERGSGHIVNVASVAGLSPYPLALPYTTSKHAVVGLSQALRSEGAGLGVRVSVVCPGAIDTAIWTSSEARRFDKDVVKRWITPHMSADQCARLVLRGVERNLATIVITREAWAAWILNRVSPTLTGRLHRLLVARARPLRTP